MTRAGGGPVGRAWVLVRIGVWGALVAWTTSLALAEMRRQAAASWLPADVILSQPGVVYRITPEGRRVKLDVYQPIDPTACPRPMIVALHGGGWRGGGRAEYGRDVARLAEKGFIVLVADYRLSRPGAPSWPDNLEDVREAVRWARRHADVLGGDPERIVALGASAGGHLSLLLGAGGADPESRVQAVVDFYGPTDLTVLDGPAAAPEGPVDLLLDGLAGERPAEARAASPRFRVTSASAPCLIIQGTDDQLIPPSQSQVMAEALDAAGVPCRLVRVPGARHGFGIRHESADFVPEILDFLGQVWNDNLVIP